MPQESASFYFLCLLFFDYLSDYLFEIYAMHFEGVIACLVIEALRFFLWSQDKLIEGVSKGNDSKNHLSTLHLTRKKATHRVAPTLLSFRTQ